MNNKLTFSGGEPNINFDDILRLPYASQRAIIQMMRAWGDNYIIQGVTGSPSVSAGYVMLDGEILRVDAHTATSTHFLKVVTYDAGGDKTFNDGTPRQTWQINRATVTAATGSLIYSGADRWEDRVVKTIAANSNEKFVEANLPISTKTAKGIIELATAAEAKEGTDDTRAMTPKQSFDKGILGQKATIAQSATPYSIPDNVGTVEITFTGDGQQVINTPTPREGRMIMIYANALQTTDRGFTFNSDTDWYNDQSSFDPDSIGNYHQVAMQSDGNKWMVINWSIPLLACPFIYINGEYFDEILKNQNSIEKYKVETIEITSVVKTGINELWLTEEKTEVTYIDYLDLIVDGKVTQRFFNDRKVMNEGDKFEFTFELGEFEKVELSAKGYYLPI